MLIKLTSSVAVPVERQSVCLGLAAYLKTPGSKLSFNLAIKWYFCELKTSIVPGLGPVRQGRPVCIEL